MCAEDLVYLTPATYDELVIKQPSEKDKSGGKRSNRWLVECYASWSPPCVHLEPMFAQLSVKYGNSTLQVTPVLSHRMMNRAERAWCVVGSICQADRAL